MLRTGLYSQPGPSTALFCSEEMLRVTHLAHSLPTTQPLGGRAAAADAAEAASEVSHSWLCLRSAQEWGQPLLPNCQQTWPPSKRSAHTCFVTKVTEVRFLKTAISLCVCSFPLWTIPPHSLKHISYLTVPRGCRKEATSRTWKQRWVHIKCRVFFFSCHMPFSSSTSCDYPRRCQVRECGERSMPRLVLEHNE